MRTVSYIPATFIDNSHCRRGRQGPFYLIFHASLLARLHLPDLLWTGRGREREMTRREETTSGIYKWGGLRAEETLREGNYVVEMDLPWTCRTACHTCHISLDQ